MRRTLFTALLLLTISAPAHAQSQAGFCKLWFTHKTENQEAGGAAYKPGVDVNGNAVTPADIDQGNHSRVVTDVIRFPLTVDLADQMHVSAPDGVEMKMPTGMVNIYRDGRVTFGDEDLSDQAFELCTGEKPVHAAAKADAVAPRPPMADASAESGAAEVPVVKAGRKKAAPKGSVSVAPKGDNRKDDIIWGEDY